MRIVETDTTLTAGDAPRWLAARVAHPVRDLDRSAAFYRDLLGLAPRGVFSHHDGYSGRFFGLPGGGELELTSGPGQPRPGTEDDLLVLYVADGDELRRRAVVLDSAGVPTVPSANPYWNRWGRTFLDPDGYLVVVAVEDGRSAGGDDGVADEVRVESYTGARDALRPLFELAEDSPSALDSYLDAGDVLVALSGPQVVGHLQLVETGVARQAEIKNMAVREDLQGHGIGGRLVEAAARLAGDAGGTDLVVATAAADIGNLRFYQRQGFRLRSVERDAFTPAEGYPPGLRIDGIELRDRVWLDRSLRRPSMP